MRSRVLEGISAGVFVAAWWLAATVIPKLPPTVPSHFGWNGTADRTGPGIALYALPVVVTVLYAGLSAAGFMPQRWTSYPVKITERNREAVYALNREMIPALKAATLLTTLIVEWGAIDAAQRGSMSPYFNEAVVAALILTFGVVIYYTLKMRAV
jgi:uncharacterized membrane protein